MDPTEYETNSKPGFQLRHAPQKKTPELNHSPQDLHTKETFHPTATQPQPL